ncbi:hypothetical protein O181_032765 [Austropuccinia psidii MF-1]|uniref:Mei2-like C-terminal RNA recognition motif domain-containing protein n=1 Tax=Austropuccinia psidii MF-1 TaxID=1389203 RepID=A0A9Q3D069_9BASI|nr:hypothetical protein [Austropuccinia psidii MF-1]
MASHSIKSESSSSSPKSSTLSQADRSTILPHSSSSQESAKNCSGTSLFLPSPSTTELPECNSIPAPTIENHLLATSSCHPSPKTPPSESDKELTQHSHQLFCSSSQLAGFTEKFIGMTDHSQKSGALKLSHLSAQDYHGPRTPSFPSSRASSNSDSPTAEIVAMTFDMSKRTPANPHKVHFDTPISPVSSLKPGESSSPFGPRLSPSSTSYYDQTFADLSVGKGSNLVSQWLPSSTSSLAEPLENDSFTSNMPNVPSTFRTDNHKRHIMITPPSTPSSRLGEAYPTKEPLQRQLVLGDKTFSRASLPTPPATVKHEQFKTDVNLYRPFSGLTPNQSAIDIISPKPHSPLSSDKPVHSNLQTTPLIDHLKRLSFNKLSRPRSASTPMEPGPDDFDKHTKSTEGLDLIIEPETDVNFGSSSSDQLLDLRKRAGTFCTPVSAPLPTSSPAAGHLVNTFFHQSPLPGSPNNINRLERQPVSSINFSTHTSNMLSSPLPSSFKLASPGRYVKLNPTTIMDDQDAILSPQRRPRASPFKHSNPSSPSPGIKSAMSDRPPRYYTAPVESSPLSKVCTQKTHYNQYADAQADQMDEYKSCANGEVAEERSMSLGDPFQLKLLQSKFGHPRFRPRSSTIADTGTPKAQAKKLLSVNWETCETNENINVEDSGGEVPPLLGNSTSPAARRQMSNSDHLFSHHVLSQHDPNLYPGPFDYNSHHLTRGLPLSSQSALSSTRYCKVLGVSPKLLGSMKGIVRVRNAFSAHGALVDIYVNTLNPVGFILIGFHDIRSISRMLENSKKALEAALGSYLKFEPIQRYDVIQLTQELDNPVLSSNEGTLSMQFEDPHGIITQVVLAEYLERYGELKALRLIGPGHWLAEWYDDRRAEAAQQQLATRDFADFQVAVQVPQAVLRPMAENPILASASSRNPAGDRYPISTALTSNVCLLPPTIRPPNMFHPADQLNNGSLYGYTAAAYPNNFVLPWSQPLSAHPLPPIYQINPPAPVSSESLAYRASTSNLNDKFVSPNYSYDLQQASQSSGINRPCAFPFPGVPPSNVIDLDRIECGSEPRTTCMIKNIPNKITDEMLFNFINEVCPRGFDFLYLRMDFKARLNVGYAFINFLSVENVLKFAKAKLGVKWGVFLSEKTVQMCYASIQGKENLIEKFRNSAIMEEEESFRPKVYHSSGPLIGLPEPFPHANDLQRKARSQANAALLARPLGSSMKPAHN